MLPGEIRAAFAGPGKPPTSRPASRRSVIRTCTSVLSGRLLRCTGERSTAAAASSGKAAFFEPSTVTVPVSGGPGRMAMTSAAVVGAVPRGLRRCDSMRDLQEGYGSPRNRRPYPPLDLTCWFCMGYADPAWEVGGVFPGPVQGAGSATAEGAARMAAEQDEAKKIGEIIRHARVLARRSQNDVATALGYHQSKVSRLE